MIRIFFLLFGFLVFGQSSLFVTKEDGEAPVSGAKIFCKNQLLGYTNSQGEFTFTTDCDTLTISFPGYFSEKIQNADTLKVSLIPESRESNIEEVSLSDESDPKAMAILTKLVERFEKNQPKQQKSYSFKGYNKFKIDLDQDSLKFYQDYFYHRKDSLKDLGENTDFTKKELKDSLDREAERKMMLRSGMFIGERALQYKFTQAEGQHIDILDSRISGVQQPIYEALALASNIDRLPVSVRKDSWKFYRYYLTDSVNLNDRETYVINFRRATTENKKKFVGTIYVDKESYGLAQYIEKSKTGNDISYIGKWKWINGSWFLENENMKFRLGNVTFKNQSKAEDKTENKTKVKNDKFGSYATLENTFFDFQVPDNQLTKKDFKGYTFRVLDFGGKELDKYRSQPLTQRETETYPAVDSVFHAKKLDDLINKGSNILRGRIRFGKIDLPINKFFDLNRYENIRLGMGIKLNENFNKYLSPDVYAAYGFRDHTWKYGVGLDVNTTLSREAFFRVEYKNDVQAAGKFNSTLWSGVMRWQNSAASIGTFNFYGYKGLGISYEDHLTDNFTFRILGERQEERALFPYDFQNRGNRFINSNFTFTIRYVFGSKSIMTPSGQYNVAEGFPRFYVNYEKALKVFGGELDYHRFDFLAIHQFKTLFGISEARLYGGWASEDAPIWKTFEGGGLRSEGKNGFFSKVNLNAYLGFGTMESGTFYNDRFIGYFLGHRIPWYFKGIFGERSAFNVIYKGTIGDFKHRKDHQLNFQPIRHLYQEVGLEWDNFFTSYLNLGFYYRVGYYNTSKFGDNFAIRLRLKLLEF